MAVIEMQFKTFSWKALDSKVLVVASATHGINEWTAYIGAVPGKNHDQEWNEVATHGSTLSYEIAKFLFPDFNKKYYWVG